MKGSTLANGADAPRRTERADREHEGLTRDELLAAYRLMLLSRKIDDKEIQLKNQSQAFFQISGAGHEAMLVAAGTAPARRLRLVLPLLSRPRALPRARHDAARDAARLGRLEGRPRQRRPADAVALGPPRAEHPVAEQLHRHAVPARRRLRRGRRSSTSASTTFPTARRAYHADEVTYVSVGDGATSEGEFWESLNTACTRKLPVLFLVEDNGYAISVPVEVQTPGGDISRVVEGIPRPARLRAATAPTTSPATGRCARPWRTCATRKGPVLVHATVTRPYSHSLSDDEKLYKTAAERESEARRDPLLRMRAVPRGRRARRPTSDLADILASVEREVNAGGRRGAAGAEAGSGHRARSSSSRPTSTRRRRRSSTEPTPQRHSPRRWCRPSTPRSRTRWRATRASSSSARTSPTPAARRRWRPVAGKGGVFKVTHGLQRRFGGDRVFNSPLAEANIVGRARRHGAARPEAGRRDPVLRLHLAGVHADPRRAVDDALPLGQPLVVPGGHPRADWRLPARRRAVSQPVGRLDLRAHARHPHRLPVERRRTPPACCARRSAATTRCSSASTSTSTARPYNKAPYPGPDYMMPFGKAAVARDGTDVVVFTWGALVQRSLLAAQQAERDGISVAVVDLRTIIPLRLGDDRRLHAQDQPRHHRARGPADVRVRRRDRRAHRATSCSSTSTRR